jgi:uncharacterized membrane protein YkvA (DUF1232 family)
MKYSQMLKIIDESGMSFEEIAPFFGISNMTLRRWEKKGKNSVVPQHYQSSIREGVHGLLIEGRISPQSKVVQDVLEEAPSRSFDAALKSLGVESTQAAESSKGTGDQSEQLRVTMVLAEIGQSRAHVEEVDRRQEEIQGFKKFGELWSRNITSLLKIVRSKEIFALDKCVAYGALFYLLFPLDLVPDTIPVVGYVDDFGLISVAAAFYLKKFPDLKGL